MRICLSLNKTSELRRAIARDNAADFKITNGLEAEHVLQVVNVTPHANFRLRLDFPALEAYKSLADLIKLQGMVDLTRLLSLSDSLLGGGSSRTRWEMEARGHFTIEGLHQAFRRSPQRRLTVRWVGR
jgi:fatty acid synthase subunit alpha, fungi type